MPDITQWGDQDEPEKLIDQFQDELEALFKQFEDPMGAVSEQGGAVLVTIVSYDPMTRRSHAKTSVKGNWHAAYGATALWMNDQTV